MSMNTLHVGERAPDFTLPDESGTTHTLHDTTGKWVLLYFYPKDDTPGCTAQACAIRDEFPAFQKLDCVVFGISVDTPKSHTKFKEKYALPFTLLSDAEKEVVHTYGVWGEKKFMGRTHMGTTRTSFLVDPHGIIAKVYENVKPALHAEEVLTDLRELQQA